MSALRQPPEYARTTVRDGRRALVKFCRGCGADKVVSEVKRESEFYVFRRTRRDDSVSVTWSPLCIACTSDLKQRRYREMPAVERRKIRQEKHRRLRNDPQRVAVDRQRRAQRARERRAEMSSEEREAYLAKRRRERYAWKQRKLTEDPDYFSREAVELRRVERQADAARAEHRRRRRGGPARRPVEVFACWLEAYRYLMEDARRGGRSRVTWGSMSGASCPTWGAGNRTWRWRSRTGRCCTRG